MRSNPQCAIDCGTQRAAADKPDRLSSPLKARLTF